MQGEGWAQTGEDLRERNQALCPDPQKESVMLQNRISREQRIPRGTDLSAQRNVTGEVDKREG